MKTINLKYNPLSFELYLAVSLIDRGFNFYMAKKSKVFFYSSDDLKIISMFRLEKRVSSINARFNESITTVDLLNVIKKYKVKCFYCDDKLPPKYWQLDHFFARAAGGKNVVENLVPTCRWCNTMKHALDGFSFIRKCSIIAEKNFLTQNGVPFHNPEEKEIKKKANEAKVAYLNAKTEERRLKKQNNQNL